MTEQDTSDLIPADILYHSLDTGIEDNDLTVLGMVDTIDIGDTVTYPADGTDLMLLCLQVEIFDLTLQDRDDPCSLAVLPTGKACPRTASYGHWYSSHRLRYRHG